MIKSRVGGEEEPEETFFLYFLASLRARKYEIRIVDEGDDDPERGIYLIIM